MLVSDEAGILRALHAGQTALWMPPQMLLRDAPDMLTSWEVTSDSLALWLARRQNAERLVVVKACTVPADLTFADLTERGTVDARFDQWASEAPFPIEVVECDEISRVRAGLLGPTFAEPGLTRVLQAAKQQRRTSGGTTARARRKPST